MIKRFSLTDDQIRDAFDGTNFGKCIDGNVDRQRKLLVQHVLKRVAGYCSGHTLTMISWSLGLTTRTDNPSKAGKQFMFDALYERKDSF